MTSSRRILVIDDNRDIHQDFQKIFRTLKEESAGFDQLESTLFGEEVSKHAARSSPLAGTTLDSAYQGEEGVQMATAAAASGNPYLLAFVDVRMPPGMDGIRTIKKIWEQVPGLPCVICTAFSDYNWEDISIHLGGSGNLYILKKPFDAVEVLQMAQAIAEKENLTQIAGQARQAIEEIDGLKRGSLVAGASTTPGVYLLPAVVGLFRARHPGIDLRLEIGNSRLIEERVRANEVDLGIVGGHELVPGERCLAAGLVDELMLVVPPRHPWLGRRHLAPGRLKEHPMLIREEGSATRRVMERALQQAGIAARTGMELGHTEAIKQGVIAGLGVAFVSTYAIRGELATRRLHALRLSGCRIQRHFHVIHNDSRELSGTARAFARLLDEEGRRLRV